MCGIIAYKGSEQKKQVIMSGLKKLEYRGYDSWGIASIEKGFLKTYKKVGKISEVKKITNNAIAIGHTRWATHGKVDECNAHPHLSQNKKIAVVHNGIIENYRELKEFLEAKRFKFRSETDTEVIPHLIEYYMNKGNDFTEASKKALKKIQGRYAVAVIHENENKLIAARNGSPLVIGVGENEYFVASDIPAFLEHTNKVIYLYDEDFVVIGQGIKIYSLKKPGQVIRPIESISWSIEQVRKGNFNHYMTKEILEQAETIQKAVEQEPRIIQSIADQINKAFGVFLVACGSSYHACLSASYVFSKIAEKHVNVVLASEFSNYEHFLTDRTLVIAVSQSGETADVLEAVKKAKEKKSKVVSIVNTIGSSLMKQSDQSLLMHAGPEICVLSTKTYTSQLALLLLLAYATIGKLEEGRKEIKKLYSLVYNLTAASTRNHVKKLAEKLKNKEHIFLIGRGLQYPTVLEAALKLKEVSYIHAEGLAGGELKHGTIALIEKNTPVIAFVSKEDKEILLNAAELKARGAYIIGVAPEKNELFNFFIKVPECSDLNPITQIIPMQVLAYQLAVLKGYDPDRPRNLAKSVTVK